MVEADGRLATRSRLAGALALEAEIVAAIDELGGEDEAGPGVLTGRTATMSGIKEYS